MRLLKIIALLLVCASPLMADVGGIVTFPDGQNGDIQFNKNKRFGADDGVFIYSTSTKRLTVPGIVVSTIIVNGQAYIFPTSQTGGYFLRTNGVGGLTWALPTSFGSSTGAASIAFMNNGVAITSPTSAADFSGTQFVVSLAGAATAYIELNPSVVTLLGPTIGLDGAEVTGLLPAASIAAGALGLGVVSSSHSTNSVWDTSIVSVSGAKVVGNIPGNATGISGTINVGQVVGAVTVYPATNTASFPYGLSGSTISVSTASVSGQIVLGDGTILRSTSAFLSSSSTTSIKFQSSNGTLISNTAYMVSLDTTTLLGTVVGGSTVQISVNPSLTVSTLTLAGFPQNVPLYINSAGDLDARAIRLNSADVANTLPIANGGTGQTSFINGQLLIGNTATGGLDKTFLTAGTGVTISTALGSITVSASGGGGGGGDSLGSHAATMTVTANYGIVTTTANVSTGLFMATGSSITNVAGTQPLYVAMPSVVTGQPLVKVTGGADAAGLTGASLSATDLTFKNNTGGASANFSVFAGTDPVVQFNSDANLCSDLSTTCRTKAVGINQIASGSGAVIDSTGKINTGMKHKTAKLAVAGSGVIGSHYSDVSDLPTNGLAVEGSLYTGSTTPATSTQFGVIGSTANSYLASFSTASVGGRYIAISTNSEVLLGGSAGTSGQVITSAGQGAIPTWGTVSGSGDMILAATQTVTGQNVFTSTRAVIIQPTGSFSTVPGATLGTTPGAFIYDTSLSTSSGFIIYNNAGQTVGSANSMMTFISTNPTYGGYFLRFIRNDSNSNGEIRFDSPNPNLEFVEIDGGCTGAQCKFEFGINNGIPYWATRDISDTTFERTVEFPNLDYNGGGISVLSTGPVRLCDTVGSCVGIYAPNVIGSTFNNQWWSTSSNMGKLLKQTSDGGARPLAWDNTVGISGSSITYAGGLTVSENLKANAGFYTSGNNVASTYVITSTDSVVFASAPITGMTVTLPAASAANRQIVQITKVDGSTGPVIVKANGTDLILGTTGLLTLNAKGQTDMLISDNISTWWPYGAGVQVTPASFVEPHAADHTSTIALAASSDTVTCPITILVPVAVTGFRFNVVAGGGVGGVVNLLLYDSNSTLVASSQTVVLAANGLTSATLATPVNIPPGQYHLGIQMNALNTTISGRQASTGSYPLCNRKTATDMTPPTSIFGTSNSRAPGISLLIAGGRQSE